LRLDLAGDGLGPPRDFREFRIGVENLLERLSQAVFPLDRTFQEPARGGHQDKLRAAQPAGPFVGPRLGDIKAFPRFLIDGILGVDVPAGREANELFID
jgi:hypothetical protein